MREVKLHMKERYLGEGHKRVYGWLNRVGIIIYGKYYVVLGKRYAETVRKKRNKRANN